MSVYFMVCIVWTIIEFDFLMYSRYVRQQMKKYVEHVIVFALKHVYFINNVEMVQSSEQLHPDTYLPFIQKQCLY